MLAKCQILQLYIVETNGDMKGLKKLFVEETKQHKLEIVMNSENSFGPGNHLAGFFFIFERGLQSSDKSDHLISSLYESSWKSCLGAPKHLSFETLYLATWLVSKLPKLLEIGS